MDEDCSCHVEGVDRMIELALDRPRTTYGVSVLCGVSYRRAATWLFWLQRAGLVEAEPATISSPARWRWTGRVHQETSEEVAAHDESH